MRTPIQLIEALKKKKAWYQKRGKPFKLRYPRILVPIGSERRYAKDLQFSFTKLFDLVKNLLFPQLERLLSNPRRDGKTERFDTNEDDLRTLLNGILVEFGQKLTDNEIRALALKRGLEVNEFNLKQNGRILKRVLDIDVFRFEPWLDDAMQDFAARNVELITTLSERHIEQIKEVVLNGMRQGQRHEEIKRIIAYKINRRTRANYRLIARDQVSKLNGQLNQLRQEDVGVQEYIWRTSLDERVRKTHRTKEGQRFSWDKPPSDTGHPGWDYQCRCTAEPILEGII